MTAFIVHNEEDLVAVAVQDLVNGDKVEGWCMESDATLSLTVNADIPIGHKIALRAAKEGDSIVKYGVSIGVATSDIGQGDHVHTHNVISARWQA